MIVSAIAAMDRRGLIGDGLAMPWHLPRDLRRFRDLTLGRPIIMGRRTFDSLGRPLPGRLNIVLSRNNPPNAQGCAPAGSVEDALEIARREALRTGAGEAMIIGGGQIYGQTLPLWDRLLLTVVEGRFGGEGDLAYFPVRGAAAVPWRLAALESHRADARNPHAHTFLELRRLAAAPEAGDGPAFDLESWLAGSDAA